MWISGYYISGHSSLQTYIHILIYPSALKFEFKKTNAQEINTQENKIYF